MDYFVEQNENIESPPIVIEADTVPEEKTEGAISVIEETIEKPKNKKQKIRKIEEPLYSVFMIFKNKILLDVGGYLESQPLENMKIFVGDMLPRKVNNG